MNEIELFIDGIVDKLHKFEGAPAIVLVIVGCWIVGYLLRFWKRFPNDGIPIAVTLFGGVIFPLIADANNELTLRVWLVRNLLIGLGAGWFSWLSHNKVLSKIEDKLGLGPKITETVEPTKT